MRVGDDTIKKTTFDHWMRSPRSRRAAADPSAKGTPKAKIPQPPDFKACIAEKKKTAPKPAKGQPKPTDAQFKPQCKQEYEGLRDQVLQFLISAEWIQGEAGDQGVKVSDKDVKKQFEKTKKQSFPKEEDFQKFLKTSGMTLEDLLYRVKLDTLSNKLREKITKGKDKVTDAADHRLLQQEQGALRPARAPRPAHRPDQDRGQGQRGQGGRRRRGQSFKAVAKKFSIDQASKNQGGVLLAVAKGQQEKALDDAVFKAKKGELVGPVKTQFGYYVFKVQKITKASQQTLAQAKETIKSLLASQGQQKALDKFVKDFRYKWKDKTNCKSGFVTQDCKNAPKPKTDTNASRPARCPSRGAPPAQGGAAPQPAQPTPTPDGQ